MPKQSNSSANVPVKDKLRELYRIAKHYQLAANSTHQFDEFFENISHYEQLLRTHCLHINGLSSTKVLEIGYGARPNRQFILHAMGVDALGVDIDTCMLEGTVSELLRMAKVNSLERAFKSLVRYLLFDIRERNALSRKLGERGLTLSIQPERFLVSPAEDANFEASSFDLIFSEGVFEHIPYSALSRLIPKMASWLRPDGLALIAPNIFPGIVGGHIAEWVWPTDHIHRRSEPWDHLRKRQYRPNTYLNELYRCEYRALFSNHFDIVDEIVRNPDLGREYLTPEIRQELAHVPDEELFSNSVLFVLKHKT